MANEDLAFYERSPGPVLHQLGQAFTGAYLRQGRLAQSLEGAGKRRFVCL